MSKARSGCERHAVRRVSGFTLIENMVALAVFAIGALAIGYLIVDGMSLAKMGQGETEAYIAAQEMIGMLRGDSVTAINYNNVNLSSVAPPTGGTSEDLNLETWWAALMKLPGTAGSPVIAATGKPRLQASIQVMSIFGNNQCPCNALITESWGQNTYVVATTVDY